LENNHSKFPHIAVELEFKIISGNNLNDYHEKESICYKVGTIFENKKPEDKLMIAISNSVTNNANEKEVLVAISRATKSDMISPSRKKENPTSTNDTNENYQTEMKGQEIIDVKIDDKRSTTIIYKVKLNQNLEPEPITKMDDNLPGGVVIFVHNDNDIEKNISCFIFNVKGIWRKFFTHDLDDDEIKQFKYPKRLQNELDTLYKKKSCIARLYNSIFDHYFFIEQYKEGIQFLQLYDLKTMEMVQFFDLHEGKFLRKFGNPIFARSNDEKIIAFSFGFGKLFLFLIENGLEIASHDFGKGVKILFCDFINNDNTIILIVQMPECGNRKILYWNLYSTNNHIKYGRKVNFVTSDENISSIARIPGKLITIDNGKICSALDSLINNYDSEEVGYEIHDIIYHNNYKNKPKSMSTSTFKTKNHTIYHRNNSHDKETKPLANNKEPWVIDDYVRTSVYLDKEENMQLFIGRSTIQVWRKNTGNKPNNKMELEYIWTNNIKADKEDKLKIIDLYIGDRSFYIKVGWNELKDDEFFEVKWPYSDNHVTPIKHACDALEHLNYRRNKLVGHKKQHEFEDLKNRISYIIWRFIEHKPNIWRLMDARFDIMAKIIIGGSNTLVKYILFGDGKKKNWILHIPRTYRWKNEDEKKFKTDDIKEKKKKLDIKNLSDLQIAIHFCKGGKFIFTY
jgi:hypothetical protein